MPCNMETLLLGQDVTALHIHWHEQNMCHKHPHKIKPFWENQCLLLLPASRICWFPLHGYKVSHPVNTQLDMKISTHFVCLLTPPFTASASTMVIQTLWLGIPSWQVPTLNLNKAGLAWRRWVCLCLSNVGSKTAIKRARDHIMIGWGGCRGRREKD